MPHKEPLSADGGEGEDPEQKARGEGECSGAFGSGEGGGGVVAGAEERYGSGPSEERTEGFPEDDADVEGEMERRFARGASAHISESRRGHPTCWSWVKSGPPGLNLLVFLDSTTDFDYACREKAGSKQE